MFLPPIPNPLDVTTYIKDRIPAGFVWAQNDLGQPTLVFLCKTTYDVEAWQRECAELGLTTNPDGSVSFSMTIALAKPTGEGKV